MDREVGGEPGEWDNEGGDDGVGGGDDGDRGDDDGSGGDDDNGGGDDGVEEEEFSSPLQGSSASLRIKWIWKILINRRKKQNCYVGTEAKQWNWDLKKWRKQAIFIHFRQRDNKSMRNWQDKVKLCVRVSVSKKL